MRLVVDACIAQTATWVYCKDYALQRLHIVKTSVCKDKSTSCLQQGCYKRCARGGKASAARRQGINSEACVASSLVLPLSSSHLLIQVTLVDKSHLLLQVTIPSSGYTCPFATHTCQYFYYINRAFFKTPLDNLLVAFCKKGLHTKG